MNREEIETVIEILRQVSVDVGSGRAVPSVALDTALMDILCIPKEDLVKWDDDGGGK